MYSYQIKSVIECILFYFIRFSRLSCYAVYIDLRASKTAVYSACLHFWVLFMKCIKTLSQGQILSVSHFEDETTRNRSISLQVDWVLVVSVHCFQVVSSAIASGVFLEPFSLFWQNFEELSVAN